MAYEIILGRDAHEREKFGLRGTILLGKHYVKMGQVEALSQPVYLDLNRAHVVFVAGKRGSGKSYCLGVVAEGMATVDDPEIRNKLSVVMLDTMGIYWTMKYPNHRDEALLKEWGFEGKGIAVEVHTPFGYFDEYKNKGIPTDFPFAIHPAELLPEDWNIAFDLAQTDPIAIFIEGVIIRLLEAKGQTYTMEDIITGIRADTGEEQHIKHAAENRFLSAQAWGVFSDKATKIKDLAKPATVSIIDLSPYVTLPGGWRVKSLVLGIVAKKLFVERMIARRFEEFSAVESAVHYLIEEKPKQENEMPIVWLMIDEAHEFLPAVGKVGSSEALITLLREGRQPGIAMLMATQQPGKIHTDAMTQSDIILAHRLTAKIDTDALGMLVQSYMRTGIDRELEFLPKLPGTCLAMDDVNERIFPMRIRPRMSWHGGSAPSVVQPKKKVFEF